MKHLAAYLLLGLGGNASPSAADIKAVLESVGIEADNERLEKLLSELQGKDINQVRLISLLAQGCAQRVIANTCFCS
jgi:Ribosomal protein L12E/L44/L45/RPP1/RPP2